MKQLSLIPTPTCTAFGGSLGIGRRKRARVLSKSKPMHFTLKASRPIQHEERLIHDELFRFAENFGVRIRSYRLNL